MVVDVVDVGRNHLTISVAFLDGEFYVATVYRDEVLPLSETRCSGVIAAGRCVAARLDRLKIGGVNSHEREEISRIVGKLKAAFDADVESLQLDA
jgi:hypothetical protein